MSQIEISFGVQMATMRFWVDPKKWEALTRTEQATLALEHFQTAESRKMTDYVEDREKPIIWIDQQHASLDLADQCTYDPEKDGERNDRLQLD